MCRSRAPPPEAPPPTPTARSAAPARPATTHPQPHPRSDHPRSRSAAGRGTSVRLPEPACEAMIRRTAVGREAADRGVGRLPRHDDGLRTDDAVRLVATGPADGAFHAPRFLPEFRPRQENRI